MRGAVFVDPSATKPYLFHLALLSIVRKNDSAFPDLADEEMLECRLVGIRQTEGAEISLCPVEHLLLLKGARGLPPGGTAIGCHGLKRQRDRECLFGRATLT